MSVIEGLVFRQTPGSVLILTVLLLLVLYFLSSRKAFHEHKKEPPGPRGLPLLGNLLQLDLHRPHNTLCELSKEYGSVFTVYFGPMKVLVLAGYKTVKQALVNHADEFGGRYIFPASVDVSQQHGILFSNGENWKEMRRFALSNLRDFGMGKKTAEEKILEECHYLIEVFEKHKGQPFDTTRPMNHAASNIISSIVYGSRFEYSDPQFKAMVARANENIRIVGTASIQLYNIFPWLGKWMKTVKHLRKNVALQVNAFRDLIHQLKTTLNPQMCSCLIDSFLIRKQNDEDSCDTDSLYHEKNLIQVVGNLFAAGTDTTATTLRWALLFMAKYPQIQCKKNIHSISCCIQLNILSFDFDICCPTTFYVVVIKVQEELSRELGGRQVRVEDRKKLPYTDAIIHETQRLASILPVSIPHITTQDVTLQGFFIRKGKLGGCAPVAPVATGDMPGAETPGHSSVSSSFGRAAIGNPHSGKVLSSIVRSDPTSDTNGTIVYPLLTSVLHDESEWETPNTFNPAHFLDMHGKFVKTDAFMPFSAGMYGIHISTFQMNWIDTKINGLHFEIVQGRRVCLGESLARMELFLFFTSLLQRFRFTPPPGVTEEELDLTPAVGFTLNPSPHQLCATSHV
ncbi:Cytochrome P450 2K1 [Merluccius polli]|uniref:Cytochrome P450 2K1 n=1 Tax=Merluccius polli TaxID=89951 RepID=A0AA47P595_MERPO|nr:Cytochrome P450 2K1 [Merluccius polli]